MGAELALVLAKISSEHVYIVWTPSTIEEFDGSSAEFCILGMTTMSNRYLRHFLILHNYTIGYTIHVNQMHVVGGKQ